MDRYFPALALCTAFFELAAATWVFRSPGRANVLRPTGLILIFLAGYQLLEAYACGNPSMTLVGRLALADVIWLPPLGVWLIIQLAAPDDGLFRRFGKGLFGIAGGLAAFILLDDQFVRRTVCQAVIATYHTPGPVYMFYGGFYQFGLMAMIFGAAKGMIRSDDPSVRRHLGDIQMGTIGFVLPALITEVVVPQSSTSTPSVMCHFAVVLAVFLVRMTVRERRIAADGMTAPIRTCQV